MAQVFSVTVLQVNQYATATGGVVTGLPSAGIVVSPSTAVVNGVQSNALITLRPTGLNQINTKYLVTATVAQVISAANA
jgi:hypothetical protein